MLNVRHTVSNSPADTIQQWFNAGGNLQFYDYDLPTYLNVSQPGVNSYFYAYLK